MATTTHTLLRTQRIIWAAQMAVPAFLLVVLVIQQRSGNLPDEQDPLMLVALGVTAAGILLASQIVPRTMLLGALRRANLKVEEVADDEPQLFRSAPKMLRVIAKPDAARARGMRISQTTVILGLALGEAVAIFGLVLGLLGFPLTHVAPFFALGWVAMAVHFPSEAKVASAIEKATGALLRDDKEAS